MILGAYTVYLDLWLCDLDGNVLRQWPRRSIQCRRPERGRTPNGFAMAGALRSGDDYVVGDVECQPLLGNAQVVTYCASVRVGGKANAEPTGMLAIHFDWEPQARAIVQGVRVGAADKARVLLVDSNFRVIAASDGQGLLTERVSLSLNGRRCGFSQDRAGGVGGVPCHARVRDVSGLGLVRGDLERGVTRNGQSSPPRNRFTVILRCEPLRRASKDDWFGARGHPSRRAARAPQDDAGVCGTIL